LLDLTYATDRHRIARLCYVVVFSGSKVIPLPVAITQFAGDYEIFWVQDFWSGDYCDSVIAISGDYFYRNI
jgi:hypothetical protein